jgi:peptidoglycan/LPS O-acetylase OafA/YrhL
LPELNGAAGALYWRVKNLGWTGVDLFFVLSGFLISGLLFKEIETTGSLNAGRFWYRRAFKILPSYLFFLIVMAATKATAWLDTTSWATIGASLAKHLLFAQNYLGHNPNGPTWSLAVEEHFYILLPCLLLLLLYKASTREQFERWLLIVGSCVIAGVPALRTVHAVVRGVSLDDYQLSHFRADGLFFGVMVQLLLRRQNPKGSVQQRCGGPWSAALPSSSTMGKSGSACVACAVRRTPWGGASAPAFRKGEEKTCRTKRHSLSSLSEQAPEHTLGVREVLKKKIRRMLRQFGH